MTKSQTEIKNLIDEYKKENNEYPDVEYLNKKTGKRYASLLLILKSIKEYPKEKKLTPLEREFLEKYKPGMKLAEVGNLLGLTRNQSEGRFRRLVEHGFITTSGAEEQKQKDKLEKPQYVRVKEGIVNAGCGGYIRDVKDTPICVLWINGVEVDGLKYHFEELELL